VGGYFDDFRLKKGPISTPRAFVLLSGKPQEVDEKFPPAGL
jgi:hypothetical protein